MRLNVSRNAAEERLVTLLTEGHKLRQWLFEDYREEGKMGRFDKEKNMPRYKQALDEWTTKVRMELNAIFPTELEELEFSAPVSRIAADYFGMVPDFAVLYHHSLPLSLDRLKAVRDTALGKYTDLPAKERIHVEDVDSFQKVRDVNPHMVASFLDNGYLDRAEDVVQLALESILGVSFHKKDWGGENNDLYTANVLVNGCRRPTAFMLKGNGLRKKVMEIRDCGKNGDQVLRLFQNPADLFVIQFVGTVSEAVISQAHGEIARLKGQGKEVHFLVMDGQDTARVMHAYGKL